jgi:hypothetical protein
MKFKIGVIGSAEGAEEKILEKARVIGREIAKYDCFLLSGGTTGVSYEAVKSAKKENGFTIGFSPAENLTEHIDYYKFPTEQFDVLITTGFGKKGRNVMFIRSCDGVIAVSGRIGTLNELTIAYDEKKIIGILTGSGGLSDSIKEIIDKSGKKGGKIIYESDPKLLVKMIVEDLKKNRGC